jgi:RNA polymerase sigma factor (sigma-70 family)
MPGRTVDEDDLAIAVGLLDRDEDALRVLLRKYGGLLKGFIRKKFGDALHELEVDAVVSGAAYKAWNKAELYDDSKASLKTWFLQIGYHQAVDLLRERKKHDVEHSVEDLDAIPELPQSRVSDQTNKKVIRDLKEVVDSLPPLQKAIIKADLKSGDVADATRLAAIHGTSKNSIYVSRNKARTTIRDELVRRGHFDRPEHIAG